LLWSAVASPTQGLGLRQFSKGITAEICDWRNGVQGSVCTVAVKKFSRCGHISEGARRKIEPTRTAVQTPPRAVVTPRGIVCSPAPRYRLSVSTCAAKVRASLLKARSALSCCGILTAARFLILEKIQTDPRSDFEF
jgi:hypothetical protein